MVGFGRKAAGNCCCHNRFEIRRNCPFLCSVNFGLFEEKTVISPLLKVLESLGRWQMNRQTYTLKVKIFQNFHKGKIEQGNIKTGRVAHCVGLSLRETGLRTLSQSHLICH